MEDEFALGRKRQPLPDADLSEGRGVGGALLDEVERRVARSARALFLLVSHWNQGGRRFYAGRGYTEVGLLRGFVLPDTDEIIYVKRFA